MTSNGHTGSCGEIPRSFHNFKYTVLQKLIFAQLKYYKLMFKMKHDGD